MKKIITTNFLNRVLLTRIFYKIFFLISFIFLFPFLLIFFTPYKNKIKFVKIRRDVIGNSIEELYLYLNIYKNNKYHYFFFDDDFVCNEYFNKICKKNFKFNFFGKTIYYLSTKIRLFDQFILKMPTWNTLYKLKTNIKNFKTPKEFKFSSIQNNVGENFLTKIGVKKNQKIICLIIRDGNYKKKYSNNKKKNWDYHAYRNADLDTYLKTIKYLNNKRYFVIRMGKGAEKVLTYKHPMYFDYAKSNIRSDFLDFWIYSKSFMSIATGTGIDALSSVYRIPTVFTNYNLIGHIRVANIKNISIFKKVKNIKKNKYLNLKELINIFFFKDPSILAKKNLMFIDNSPIEILNATKEMINLIDKKLTITKIYNIKEKIFWKRLIEIYDNKIDKKNIFDQDYFGNLVYVYKNIDIINNKISIKFFLQNMWIQK